MFFSSSQLLYKTLQKSFFWNCTTNFLFSSLILQTLLLLLLPNAQCPKRSTLTFFYLYPCRCDGCYFLQHLIYSISIIEHCCLLAFQCTTLTSSRKPVDILVHCLPLLRPHLVIHSIYKGVVRWQKIKNKGYACQSRCVSMLSANTVWQVVVRHTRLLRMIWWKSKQCMPALPRQNLIRWKRLF